MFVRQVVPQYDGPQDETVPASTVPANTIRWHNAGLMLGRRLRRRPNIKPTLDKRLEFAGVLKDETVAICIVSDLPPGAYKKSSYTYTVNTGVLTDWSKGALIYNKNYVPFVRLV